MKHNNFFKKNSKKIKWDVHEVWCYLPIHEGIEVNDDIFIFLHWGFFHFHELFHGCHKTTTSINYLIFMDMLINISRFSMPNWKYHKFIQILCHIKDYFNEKFVLHELCSPCQQIFAFVLIDFRNCEMVQLFFVQYNTMPSSH